MPIPNEPDAKPFPCQYEDNQDFFDAIIEELAQRHQDLIDLEIYKTGIIRKSHQDDQYFDARRLWLAKLTPPQIFNYLKFRRLELL